MSAGSSTYMDFAGISGIFMAYDKGEVVSINRCKFYYETALKRIIISLFPLKLKTEVVTRITFSIIIDTCNLLTPSSHTITYKYRY